MHGVKCCNNVAEQQYENTVKWWRFQILMEVLAVFADLEQFYLQNVLVKMCTAVCRAVKRQFCLDSRETLWPIVLLPPPPVHQQVCLPNPLLLAAAACFGFRRIMPLLSTEAWLDSSWRITSPAIRTTVKDVGRSRNARKEGMYHFN